MIKFVYEIDENKKYVFRYDGERLMATVNYPDGTTSQIERLDSVESFRSWVCNILGKLLPLNSLALFQHVFSKEINNGSVDFNIQSAFLVSNCMSDGERDSFRAEAIKLDQLHFENTGLRLKLDHVPVIYTVRYRMEAQMLLASFNEMVKHSVRK